MKNFLRFLILCQLSLIFTFIGCAPKDKNLNRPQFGNVSQSFKGFRVGSYGQAIWAVQNVQQAGSLIRFCVASPQSEIELKSGRLIKVCEFKPAFISESNLNSNTFINEAWKITIEFELNNSKYTVLSAVGNLENSNSTILFNGQKATIQFNEKFFSLNKSENGFYQFKLQSKGEMKSNLEKIELTHQVLSGVQIENKIWNLTQFEHQLHILNRGQIFNISSPQITLNWVYDLCAEASGDLQTVEVGKPAALILLNQSQAKQVTEPGRRGWFQKLPPCKSEKMSSFNFEFLFY